ncbi:MAG: cyclic nucleotide-binding domain-containing protein [bacterium]|nr:cyclic nucleotide-binding domain-containing protein [bacterium]
MARKSTEVTYPPGATVVEQGDPGDLLCIIVQGTVEVRRDGSSVAQMGAGAYFGEISLIDGQPRSATVVAVDDVVLLTLSSLDFDAVLNTPYVARSALKGLAALVRELQNPEGQNRL